jgi:hypothetical protein
MPTDQLTPFIAAQVCVLSIFGVLCWYIDMDASVRCGILLGMEIAAMFGACTGSQLLNHDEAPLTEADGNDTQAVEDPCDRAKTTESRTR